MARRANSGLAYSRVPQLRNPRTVEDFARQELEDLGLISVEIEKDGDSMGLQLQAQLQGRGQIVNSSLEEIDNEVPETGYEDKEIVQEARKPGKRGRQAGVPIPTNFSKEAKKLIADYRKALSETEKLVSKKVAEKVTEGGVEKDKIHLEDQITEQLSAFVLSKEDWKAVVKEYEAKVVRQTPNWRVVDKEKVERFDLVKKELEKVKEEEINKLTLKQAHEELKRLRALISENMATANKE